MKFIQEFKEFAVKGNMIDLAIGVVIGAAFNKIVDTLVKYVVTPPLGYLTSGSDISDLKLVLREPTLDAAGKVQDPGVVIEYGIFLEACIDFLIIALTIFLVVKAINSLRRDAEDEKNPKVPTPKDIALLADIRDQMRETNALLKKQDQ
ncbi:large-conductance mechanosensitive channel protein MscL [Flavilitoribacter nigricans]|uniref:Large-conductance mechanosensitive channel n=1 Tax=Flavilitoribacter nigricans (strain ATCC 23147 / DSM 23189 / NBRC 102662 / NCIMB 1420 / SS-2) TaxID=1122177 RepID=A0A2D0NBZ9_FLAN2|nr:large-conductance mechanosensitive channel protein MscL [Flavilitoribacter nigricans]PHN06017.1 large conductance mechanosensitive channel protein MscL [Flavilitoribacter nigricans DSM 23189 = NBRC 102662]